MPEKYHIETKPVPPRGPRIGKFGVVDWREDCARCHNCVKKACVYDRYREESQYIRSLSDVDTLFFDCMGCYSCIQDCTKGLLCMSINPVYEGLGNSYWTPEIIKATWLQAETAKIPVSGAGYRGPFSGPGFDSMWTDMSEIVRPTRDGIHGREYISTSVDIGRKPSHLSFEGKELEAAPSLVSLPMPVIIDMIPSRYSLPELDHIIAAAAKKTGLVAIMDSADWPLELDDKESYLPHLAFYLNPKAAPLPSEVLAQTRLVEIPDSDNISKQIEKIKKEHPHLIVAVRVELSENGTQRAIELGTQKDIEVLHVVADPNGNQMGSPKPLFIKDMIRSIHTSLIKSGSRDEVTVIAGGGIALAEHLAKAVICGADMVSVELPLLISLECHLCDSCKPGQPCPAKLEDVDFDYARGRMTNIIGAWHGQLIEVMGAMGMREVRRLRGEVGRAMFYEELEENTFGKLFGKRKLS